MLLVSVMVSSPKAISINDEEPIVVDIEIAFEVDLFEVIVKGLLV